MARIYTKGGDRGETGLIGGARVPKADARIEALGAVDELNALLGLALAQLPLNDVRERLATLQPDLFAIGSHLAAGPGAEAEALPRLPGGRVAEMERWIDEAEIELPRLRRFILPGGSEAGATLHVARTVCRRAERAVVRLGEVAPEVTVYLNRLSDLLFDMARLANHRAGSPEVQWLPELASEADAGTSPATVDVAAASDLDEGLAREHDADGREVLLCKVDGSVYAVQPRCPYHPAPLDASPLHGSVLTCRWYGAAFDVRSGASLGSDRVEPLETYPVTVVAGRVRVTLASPGRAPASAGAPEVAA